METESNPGQIQIDKLYLEYSKRIFGFICSRIDNRADAENLAQDVWVRVIEHSDELIEETIGAYIYRIASNIVNDYLRQRYARPSFDLADDHWNDIAMLETPQETLEAMQLAEIERNRVECLPPQRRTIYIMSRYEEKAVLDIARELSLSLRTVENHLRLGRHDVRSHIRALA